MFFKKALFCYLNKNTVAARKIATKREVCEIRIPVQWGHVAGKWWGPRDKRPILALHGWQDNAGTFDRLIPYLPFETPVLAIDAPGHGLSSQIPHGMTYHGTDILRLLYEIVRFFEWSKVSFLGHSMGAILSALFTVHFPDLVDFIICIDNLKPLSLRENAKDLEANVKEMELFIKYNQLNSSALQPPVYTWEDCVKNLSEGSKGSVSIESCKYLLYRNLKESQTEPNKFYFTRDPRIKAMNVSKINQTQSVEYYKRIICPILVLKADKSPYDRNKEKFFEVLEVVKKSSRGCKFFYVPGTHHVHLNNPEVVEGHINDFLKIYDTGNRGGIPLKKEIFL
ncbi:probable serine hydrolase isoform X1 [Agrilus planipennis]|uniref:Probable serine hydrolase isoform X1 n=1 Tax=Agrilus planipennis TaxID=224129 RepID=A0A1W4W4W7_AGRPL|nr:probable serine hydrolase isoform X1 [Agrilus planipennis]